MKNILFLATQPQRFLDKLNLANEIDKKTWRVVSYSDKKRV